MTHHYDSSVLGYVATTPRAPSRPSISGYLMYADARTFDTTAVNIKGTFAFASIEASNTPTFLEVLAPGYGTIPPASV